MGINIFGSKKSTSFEAASKGEDIILAAQQSKSIVTIVLATGASQIDVLETLAKSKKINWKNCEIYHLDEYIGLSEQHKASFVKFLEDRFISKIGQVSLFEAIHGNAINIDQEISRLNVSIQSKDVDLAFVGIGENSHIAFNDPPANFQTKNPFIRVSLDKKCKNQQVGEGWFARFNQVPKQAITMSISQILKSKEIICTVLDDRKAEAVKHTIEGPINNKYPASILQKHSRTHFYIDSTAAKLLQKMEKKISH